MTFNNVVVIEKTGKIGINEKNLFCGPMSIADIEVFEDCLIKSNTPYILAQVETTVPCLYTKNKSYRFIKGYCLFTKVYNTED